MKYFFFFVLFMSCTGVPEQKRKAKMNSTINYSDSVGEDFKSKPKDSTVPLIILFEANNLRSILEIRREVFDSLKVKMKNNYYFNSGYYDDSVLPKAKVIKNDLNLDSSLIALILQIASYKYNQGQKDTLIANQCCSSNSVDFCQCYLVDVNHDSFKDLFFFSQILSGTNNKVYYAYLFNPKRHRFEFNANFFEDMPLCEFTDKYVETCYSAGGGEYFLHKNVVRNNKLVPLWKEHGYKKEGELYREIQKQRNGKWEKVFKGGEKQFSIWKSKVKYE